MDESGVYCGAANGVAIMRCLTQTEIDQVGGGNPLAQALGLMIVGGVVYDGFKLIASAAMAGDGLPYSSGGQMNRERRIAPHRP